MLGRAGEELTGVSTQWQQSTHSAIALLCSQCCHSLPHPKESSWGNLGAHLSDAPLLTTPLPGLHIYLHTGGLNQRAITPSLATTALMPAQHLLLKEKQCQLLYQYQNDPTADTNPKACHTGFSPSIQVPCGMKNRLLKPG